VRICNTADEWKTGDGNSQHKNKHINIYEGTLLNAVRHFIIKVTASAYKTRVTLVLKT
jgi:hypothetical protein